MGATPPDTLDAYIAGFPAEVQERLQAIRTTIRAEVPEAEEAISYRIPTFRLGGRALIYVAAFANHVSVYPAPVHHPDFAEDMARYGSGRGTARFPMNEPIPFELITRMVRFRLQEHRARAGAGRGGA